MRLRISTRTLFAVALGAVLAACSAKAPAPPAAEPAKPITREGARTPEAGPPPAQSEPAAAGAAAKMN